LPKRTWNCAGLPHRLARAPPTTGPSLRDGRRRRLRERRMQPSRRPRPRDWKRGGPIVRRPTKAIVRRPTVTSRGSTCASSGPCSRPPARGTTAECVANHSSLLEPPDASAITKGLASSGTAQNAKHSPMTFAIGRWAPSPRRIFRFADERQCGVTCACRPKRQRGLAECQQAPASSYFCSPSKAGVS
jgi:hypothetical protein